MPQLRTYIPLPLPVAGVHREISQIDMPANVLRDSQNWLYRDGRLRVRDGLTQIGSATSGRVVGFANWLEHLNTPASPVLVAATTAKYYVWNLVTQTWTDLAGALTGDETTHNIMRIFQKGDASGTVTTMYGCNGANDCKKYVYGDATVSAMGATVPRARAMMVLGDRMLLANLTQNGGAGYAGALGPQVVSVSASQDPTTGYGTVLEAQLQDTPGEIVCMMEMGNLQGAIYKDDAIYMATVASDVVPYTFSLKAVVPGPVSPRAVIRVNDSVHIYLATNGDIIRFDGVSATPMGRHLQRYVLDTWNKLHAYRSHGWYDHENNEVCIAYSDIGTGDCTREIVIRLDDDGYPLWPYTYATNVITAGIRAMVPGGTRYVDLDGTPPFHGTGGDIISDLTLALDDYNALGTALVLGASDGSIFTNDGTTDDGVPIDAYFEGGLISFDAPNVYKAIQYIDYVFTAPSASQVVTTSIEGTNFGDGPNTLSTSSVDIYPSGQHRTYHRCSDIRMGIRVSCDASQPVELNAGYLAYVTQGKR